MIEMKKKKILTSLILGLLVIIALLSSSINIIVDYQWFKELGYLSVYFTKVLAVLKLTVPVFLVAFLGITLYYRSLIPNIRKLGKVVEIDKVKEKKHFKIFLFINFIVSMIFSIIFSSEYWYKILEYTSSTKFNLNDPIFNKDISFFVFKLPLIQSLYNSAMSLMVLLVVGTFVIYMILTAKDKVFNKTIQVDGRNIRNLTSGITSFAGKQLAVIAAFIMLLISLGYMINGWNLAYSPRGIVFGASYTDVTVSLKFFKVITIVALVGAFVVFFSIMAKKVKPIIISVVIIVILMVGENLAAGVVQKFIVQSNEKSLEKPYIEHNINYTKKAFNIDEIKQEDFQIKNELTAEKLKANEDVIDNIKVNSYRPALEFYNQFQYIRYYYNFNDIDIDRYNINGKYNQVFIAARELDFEKLDNNNTITWQNKHLAYTHGYGVVMSKVNSVTSEGQPDFIMSNIPIANETNVPIDNPRIYFGEGTNDYSIVNTKLGEIDYPMGGENATNNYDGNAGINMTFLNKLLFALKEQNPKFILSNDITKDSKIILHKNVLERVNKIAPFLRYDKDPYVVISDNRLYWMIDGYTTSDKFPFSQPMDGINYIRNSVKVVIDAYNGDTNFYVVDENDPIAVTYSKIFPELFKSSKELSKDLKDHFRYPEDLFTIQSNVLSKYHVSDPGVFYNGDDVWSIAEDKEKVETEQKFNEADYVTMKLPNEGKEEMVILEYFNTKGRDNMVAMYGARMDGENYGKMFLYEFPTGGTVYSPMLFKQKINQDPVISKEISLWDTKGSEVQFGDILIVPIENSLLYVEPLYLRASGEKSIPEMRNVIVGYGDKLVLAPNIETALKNIFNIKDEGNNKPNLPGTPVITGDMSKVKEAYKKAIEAQKNGDWAKYGQYINELGNLINSLSQ
ncbi:uncharacterized membrane protein (UPF0182 family) [Clostridium punense]|uniref:UPF0182 protein J2Z44_004186 n=2 Tax=Clostridiaceae TaxID=31979 RepID=A0ABS4K965_9CLOT|nr:hypothetical protein M918_23305 [Clostridium sp. BL8]MBP2024326.1 uncharacterized membrane protein (UPF0182 family) [Clostridium punense]